MGDVFSVQFIPVLFSCFLCFPNTPIWAKGNENCWNSGLVSAHLTGEKGHFHMNLQWMFFIGATTSLHSPSHSLLTIPCAQRRCIPPSSSLLNCHLPLGSHLSSYDWLHFEAARKKSQNARMVWMGKNLKAHPVPPLPWAGTPSTIPGCSKPQCPTWPWTLPGIQGQPQLLCSAHTDSPSAAKCCCAYPGKQPWIYHIRRMCHELYLLSLQL